MLRRLRWSDLAVRQASGNPFAAAIAQLESAFPLAPDSYRIRLIVQFVLCGLLFALSLAFLVLHCLHARIHGRDFWLIRLHRASDMPTSWRQLVVNSIPFFALLAAMSAAGQAVSRWKQWEATISRSDPYNTTAANFLPWIIIFFQAWAFSYTNFLATLTAKRHLGSHMQWLSLPSVHNSVFLGFPILVCAVLVPPMILANIASNRLTSLVAWFTAVLKTAAADAENGQPLDYASLLELQQREPELTASGSKTSRILTIVCGLSIGVAVIIMAVNMYSLMLVLILRRHVKNTIQRRSECDRPVIFTRDMQVAVDRSLTADDARPEVENAARGRATDLISPEPMATVPFSSFSIRSQIAATASQNAGAVGQNELALRRLASDLSFAVPVTILMCGILISGVGVLVAKQFRFTSWPLYEFTTDAFAYVYLGTTVMVVGFFIANLVRSWGAPESSRGHGLSAREKAANQPGSSNHFTVELRPKLRPKSSDISSFEHRSQAEEVANGDLQS